MLELKLPTRHEWVQSDKTYGKLVIEPFEPGFALTTGIAYRRVLLSAIHGAAPTWVKIENVLHEFSHLPGVVEDTLDIMMNLRNVVFALHVNRPKILRLKAQGPGVDCFALAAVVYFALAGRPPFTEPDARQLLARQLAADVDCDFAPAPIAEWLRRGLDPDPEKRFADAGEMRDAWHDAVDAAERRERARRWWRGLLGG